MKLINSLFIPPLFKAGKIGIAARSVAKMSLMDTAMPLAINAWSVDPSALNSPDIASNIFASSLFPYLALLFFLSRPETNVPKLGNFGFQFLLVFVFATIPAGILSKLWYQDTLSNVDYLHGIAESFLTITNLLIISGFRQTREKFDNNNWKIENFSDSLILAVPILLAVASTSLLGYNLYTHAEPSNALSIPTWIVHSSSLLEWLVAMKLIWEHAETSGNPRWKGMTWGMIPSHASGICACTYHFFYNSPSVLWLVTLQATLTVLGNSTMALASYRIYDYAKKTMENAENETGVKTEMISKNENKSNSSIYPFPELVKGNEKIIESDIEFWINMFVKSALLAFIVKYGELSLDAPFNPQASIAAGLIVVPTLINMGKWYFRSSQSDEAVETAVI